MPLYASYYIGFVEKEELDWNWWNMSAFLENQLILKI